MNGRREQEAAEERPEDERAQAAPAAPTSAAPENGGERPPECGGPKGPEPTRYGDWERSGRCIDF